MFLSDKGKLNNMEQLQMQYWETDIKKVNELNFLSEEVGGIFEQVESKLR